MLESVGDQESQQRLRNQYWAEHLPIIAVGQPGGVWDHVRAYAEAQWRRSHADQKERRQIFGDKRKFAKHCRTYASALLSSVICSTQCVVCDKQGQVLRSLAACPMEDFVPGETLQDRVLPTLKQLALHGHLVCKARGCAGNARKEYKSKLTQLARLLVIVTRERAVQHVAMEEMDLGVHGKYTLTGVGHYNAGHWVCTFMFNSAWYRYDDISANSHGGNVSRVEPHTYTVDGFDNAVYFYTKLG